MTMSMIATADSDERSCGIVDGDEDDDCDDYDGDEDNNDNDAEDNGADLILLLPSLLVLACMLLTTM